MQRDPSNRAAPHDMPRNPAPPDRDALRGKQKPKDKLPEQAPVTDEVSAVKAPAKWKKILARVVTGVLLALALAAAYVFLLLGEPDEESKLAQTASEKVITMPMTAVESLGDTNLQSIADAFDEPLLALYGSGLTMQKARVYDTAFEGGYARRVTLSYALSDGSQLNLESIRPTAAVTLLSSPSYKLESGSLYTLAGNNAARMESSSSVCVFAQGDAAVYAVTCAPGHDEELQTLLKQTTLIAPTASAS